MSNNLKIRNILPYPIYKRLFGDRRKYNLYPDNMDKDLAFFKSQKLDFYNNTQQKGVGDRVSRMAYSVVRRVNFAGKKVLEIGPGVIRHLQYINEKPKEYALCDINQDFLEIAAKQLKNSKIPFKKILNCESEEHRLPFEDKSIDIIISFNSLEHLYPLDSYLLEMKRVLSNSGLIVGGIPCEGGLAWGIGRFLTTRRYVHKKYGINYDKIICWQHPNFADFILQRLDNHFNRKYLKRSPFFWLPMDLNLVTSYIYEKSEIK